MDELLKEWQYFKDLTSTFTPLDVIFSFGLSFICSLVIGNIYKATHRGVSYSQSYVQSLVIMCVTVAMIMLVVGSNIARAFSLVGALSIIRFRNAVKETRDVGYMFLVMAIGMSCGTKFYMLAICFTLFISGVVYLMYKLNLFSQELKERILVLKCDTGSDVQKNIEGILEKHFLEHNLVSIESGDSMEKTQEWTYSVLLKKKFQSQDFFKDTKTIHDAITISLFEGQQQLDI